MPTEVIKQIDDPALTLGVVEVTGGIVREASDELKATAAALAATMGAEDFAIPEEKRTAVRKLLKIGGFSPTGRNRPAHELLVKDLKGREGFHHINNVVDVNNVLSLELLLPISIFDVDKFEPPLIVRIAAEGEGYVFNQSGQYMDLKRCIVCCNAAGEPIGSPVKDSMATKVFEGASHFLGLIYIPAASFGGSDRESAVQRFADLLAEETGGSVLQSLTI